MFKRASWLAAILVAAAGCAGSDGSQGAQGPTGPAGTSVTAEAKLESCDGCHQDSGSYHQASYNQYTADTLYAVQVLDVQTVGTTSQMTFGVTYNGTPYNDPALSTFDQMRFYAVIYEPATRKFGGSVASFAYASPALYGDGLYVVTTASSSAGATFAPESATTLSAEVYMFLAKNPIKSEGSVTMYKDVAGGARTYGATLDYVSAANVTGCEKCHGHPFKKEGYRPITDANLPDFATCKICHYDSRTGGHQAWALLANEPAAFAAQLGTPTSAQKTKYAYTASLMNDVHMSHAMELEYPQSMANCVTCHEGKLATIQAPANFRIATCKSCHPMYPPANAADADTARAPALSTLMTATSVASTSHTDMLVAGLFSATATNKNCSTCHTGGAGNPPLFSDIHSGYNDQIYTSTGTRYSDAFNMTVDSASFAGTTLTVSISARNPIAVADPTSLASITPTILIGLYGWDSKDFVVNAHGSDTTLPGSPKALEWVFGKAHPRFAKVAAGTDPANGKWKFVVDLSTWSSDITSSLTALKMIQRAEIAVLPTLKKTDGTVVALNAPSKTFDFPRKRLALPTDPSYSTPIVDATKCNKCHEALGTTFHSGDRGGNVTVCRLCHQQRSGAAHLEMQSRSIDSYVHAIHSFQAFDVKNIDFTGVGTPTQTVAAMRYGLKSESNIPMFTLLNCEMCHVNNGGAVPMPPTPGVSQAYDVPSQSKSLAGLLSASATNATWTRNIGTVPSYVTGPASRACGSCHRARLIKEDDATALDMFNAHVQANGTLVPETATPAATINPATSVTDEIIEALMALF